MSNLTLQLEGDALREAIAQSILGQLTPEAQQALLDQAIQAILKPSTNSWDKGMSPLERAFASAVERVAQQEAVRLVTENQEIKAKMEELLRQTADKVLAADTEVLAERMANAFVASMRRD
jgi:agmatine/peptidylarginine deiminase